MRIAAILLACLAAACNAPPQLILPDKLDLPVASSDRLKLCPDDGLEDTTPDADCVLTSAADPTEPYIAALEKRGWTPGREADQLLLLRWISAPKPNGERTCLTMTPMPTNAARRDGALVEFRIRPLARDDADLSCSPPSSTSSLRRIKVDALDIPLLDGTTPTPCPDPSRGYFPGEVCVSAPPPNAILVVQGYSRLVEEAGWSFYEGAGAVVRYQKDGRQLTMGFPMPAPGELFIASFLVEAAPQ